MALTRKMLKALGIEEEKIDQIIEAHSETVESIKAERDRLKEDADKLPELQKLLKEKTDAAEKGGTDLTKLKDDYEKLTQEYEQYKTAQETEKKKTAITKAYTELLKDLKVSDSGISKILKYTSSGVELDEDGKLKNVADLKKSIRDEWGEYISTEQGKGADTPTPPGGAGKGGTMSKDEIMKIKNATERQKAIAENLSLFE